MEIHFEIENKCLLTCKHCSSYASNSGGIKQYTDDDMVSFLSRWPCEKKVYLTGGEPLLYPEIDKLLSKLNTRVNNITLGMFTTGIMETRDRASSISEEYAYHLAKNGLNICYLSIYSPRQDEHDKITRLAGSFELTKKSIIALNNAGVEVRFNSVVTTYNEKAISNLLGLAERWGVSEVRLLKLIRHGRAKSCWDEIGITEEQYRNVVIDALKKKTKVNVTASGVEDIVSCRKFCDINICPAGKQLWYITYKGEVYPCASVKNKIKYQIGHIYDKDIFNKADMFNRWKIEEKLC